MEMKKTIMTILILLIVISTISAVYSTDNVRPLTTTYNTTCDLNIGKGLVSDECGVEGQTQVIAFDDGYKTGYFISMPKADAADLINTIQTGKKASIDGVVFYHLEDKELANGWGAFGSHLKLKTVDSVNVGFLESPNSDEVIVVMGGPDTIVDCLKSVKWG